MYSYTKRYQNLHIKKNFLRIFSLVLACVIIVGVFRVAMAFPSVYGVSKVEGLEFKTQPKLPWPGYGQSAAGVDNYGLVSESPNQKAVPMASVTKVVTALAILEKHPLKLGEQGNDITFKTSDVQIYDEFLQKQGVVVDIKPGQSISQYKALQYMLILSANNVAKVTANWAFGSLEEYTKYANQMVDKLGLESINVDDAAGFSPKTVATASDLVRLGDIALDNPVIAEIVSTDYVNLPDGSQSINTNPFLNYENNGVIGIKNGLTDEAGGVLLAAAKRKVDGADITVITAVMGSEQYFTSQKDAIALIDPTVESLKQAATINAGEVVGFYQIPWSRSIDVITKDDIELTKWSNAISKTYVELYPILGPVEKGDTVGLIRITNDDGSVVSSEVVITESVTNPSLKWRVKNPTK